MAACRFPAREVRLGAEISGFLALEPRILISYTPRNGNPSPGTRSFPPPLGGRCFPEIRVFGPRQTLAFSSKWPECQIAAREGDPGENPGFPGLEHFHPSLTGRPGLENRVFGLWGFRDLRISGQNVRSQPGRAIRARIRDFPDSNISIPH